MFVYYELHIIKSLKETIRKIIKRNIGNTRGLVMNLKRRDQHVIITLID